MAQEVRSLDERMAVLENALVRSTTELDRVSAAYRRMVRTNRLVGIGFAATMAAVLLGAARGGFSAARQEPQPLTVRAPFKVVDDAGRPVVTVEATNQRGLFVRSAEGVPLVGLGAWGSATGIEVQNRAHEIVADLGTFEGEQAVEQVLVLYSGPHRQAVVIRASPDLGGLIFSNSSDGATYSELSANRGYAFGQGNVERINLGPGEKHNLAY
jgi:hypothetical protein